MTVPRPGHADLTGAVKYGYRDLRLSLERASARETAMRVGLGACCRALLLPCGCVLLLLLLAPQEIVLALPCAPLFLH